MENQSMFENKMWSEAHSGLTAQGVVDNARKLLDQSFDQDAYLAGVLWATKSAAYYNGGSNAAWRSVVNVLNEEFVKTNLAALQAAFCDGEALYVAENITKKHR